jgi:hypothetical protein
VALVVAAAVDSGVAVATVVQLSHQKQFWLMLQGLLWSRFTIKTQCFKMGMPILQWCLDAFIKCFSNPL